MKSQNLYKIINKHGWKLYITRPIDLLTIIANTRSNSNDFINKFGFGVKTALHISQNGLVQYFRDVEEQQKYKENIYDLIKRKPNQLLFLLEEALKLNRKIKDKIDKDNKWKKFLKNKTAIELGKIFRQSYELFQHHFMPCVVIPYFVGEAEKDLDLSQKQVNNLNYSRLLQLSKKLRLVSYYVNYRNIIINALFREISRKSGIEYNLFNYLTPEEIIQVADGIYTPDKNINRKRKNYIYLRLPLKEHLIFDSEIIKKVHILLNDKIRMSNSALIKGQVAYKGKVKGIAKIIYAKKDFKKFNKGDILITINSNPSLMPVIKKCKAIISDEGGLLCHAAIISRELKIPCIIGTKIATKVLKDRDLVEVDADKGMVKILKKK